VAGRLGAEDGLDYVGSQKAAAAVGGTHEIRGKIRRTEDARKFFNDFGVAFL
jgi:hypothetical protein